MNELYKPFVSKSKGKKYSVRVVKDGKPKLIHFGDSSMGVQGPDTGMIESAGPACWFMKPSGKMV